jgi:DivIVA domain-containing protein
MSPEPSLDATGIARRQFSTARKGYDPAEVRAFLHELSDLVGRLQRAEAHERERAERAESRAHLAEQLDEHRLVELLGEETARVLEAARDAAGDIRSKAEESAARMVREAQVEARALTEQADREAAARRTEILSEADALRREAEAEVERRRVEGQIVAADMRREAELERERMLSDGERARTEAEAAAEQIRAAARDQGRRLVGEAQTVRERMLGDLSRRRRTAREQLERLNGARERLLAAYEVVRRTVDEATNELTVALPEAKAASEMAMRRVVDEPAESVEVIEAELSVARMSGLVDDVAASAVSDDELDAMLRELAEEEEAQAAAAAAQSQAGADEPQDDGPSGGDAGGQAADRAATPGPEPEAGAEAEATAAADPVVPDARPVSDGDKWGIRLPRPRPSASSPEAEPATPPVHAEAAADAPTPAGRVSEDEGESGPYVDELFARIRAERTPGDAAPDVAPGASGHEAASEASEYEDRGALAVAVRPEEGAERSAEGAPPADPAPAGSDVADERDAANDVEEPVDAETRLLRRRDDLLAAVERDLGRKLKRVLADEQNEVLDLLRRGGTVEFADVVPAADEHVDRFAIAASAHLDVAAAHGAAVSGGDTGPSCDELSGMLGRALVEPLRRRIQRSFDESDGDLEEVTERLRALYREWKGNHIGNEVRHHTATAYALGAYDSASQGAPLRWIVDPSCHACPDCDDNALAGQVVKGEPYPTGDTCAPAHPDCRCLVVAASTLEVD